MSDHFEDPQGLIYQDRWRPRLMGRLRDALFDAAARLTGADRKAAAIAAATPVRKVLVLGVAHPERPGELEAVAERLRDSRHEVSVALVAMEPGLGKFQNIGRALAQVTVPLQDFDWVVITDDDVGLPERFLDKFLGLAEQAGLMIAQPAHRFYSYTTFAITQRHWGSLVRATRWVEIGPVTALHRDTLADLIPFPPSRWDWGLDTYWAQLADEKGWPLGVVDGASVEHRRPVAGGYDIHAAIAAGGEFLQRHKVTFTRADCFSENRVVVDWRPTPAARSSTARPSRPSHRAFI